jgi:hypothetical protein
VSLHDDYRHFAHLPVLRENVKTALGLNGREPTEADFDHAPDWLVPMFSAAIEAWSARHDVDPMDSWPVLEELARMRNREAARRIFDRERAGDRPTMADRLLSGADLAGLPEPGWLIDRWLPAGGLTVAYGPKGVGKSFVTVDVALSIARGVPFARRQVRQGRVLYVVGEGVSGMARRREAWHIHQTVAETGGGDLWLPHRVDLTDETEAGELASLAADRGVVLVVVDTLNRCMPGSDEGAADMGAAVAAADLLRDAGRAVLLVHHSGKDQAKGSRGHSSLIGAADTVLRITGDGRRIRVEVEHQKDDEPAEPLAFRMVDAARSVALTPARPGEGTDEGRAEITLAKAAVIAVRKLAEKDGMAEASMRQIMAAWPPARKAGRDPMLAGIEMAVSKGWLIERAGPRNARLMSLGSDIPVDQ